ncbi:galactokinase [Sphaerisporangium melleum]|uniref:Galactokinase n=1 Tax=Sphaerisporangium melleum TaxID=321316 RepID=A0A917VCH7_9ACTN|nr:galactokinase [Sphaerisporangium melleum]GGK62711.1 galactokinase [Sphaerisporangium melleum]GII67999.1 galactokinase [Sphaerisporangium melleum]
MRAVDAFRAAYGRDPERVWHAPGRVNLIGEHTDYNDGFVLPFAVPWGVTAAVSRRDDDTIRLLSLQGSGGEGQAPEPLVISEYDQAQGWSRYVVGVFWALREAGHAVRGADIVIDGDVPQGAGLSSSAALEVSVAMALDDLYELGLARLDLALLSQKAENDFVGMPCGIMDQAASALSREGHVLFMDCRSLATRNVPLDLAAEGLQILIIDTGAHHELADGQYARRRRDCESAAAHLGVRALRDVTDLAAALARLDGDERKRVQHVVTENHRVEALIGLLRAGAVREIGALLNASHISLRDQYEVSSPELDVAVEASLRGGARGARMTGGGFGGSAIALVADDRADQVRAEVVKAYEERGWAAPRFFPASLAAGAHRLQ